MIPVIISDNGKVIKIDISKEWYSYEKKWANVVLVNSSKRDYYKNMNVNSEISSSDILAYLVWIPRFKYILPTNGTTTKNQVNIIFENKNTNKSSGNAKTTYLTHPSFTFDKSEYNGIWVGKFETTGDTTTPTILPNITSLRTLDVKTQFETSLKFKNDKYGLTNES